MSGFEIDLVVERGSGSAPPFRLAAAFESGGGITVVFGASGSGKSTLLLAVLGAVRPERGRVHAAGRLLYDSAAGVSLAVHRRRTGIVFQDALLFPHLTAAENVRFGLRSAAAGKDPGRISQPCDAAGWLERVGAVDLAGRLPAELSGGQRQRVALARALAARPAALLLDEPFSALDAAARESLGNMLIELQRESAVPFLHVTHDLGEAVRLGNELVVLERGEVVQSGSPTAVVSVPVSAAAARAVGTENLFTATVARQHREEGYTEVDLGGTRVVTAPLDLDDGDRVALGLRAEDILLALEAVRGTSARNVIAGTVERIDQRGRAVEVAVTTPVRFRVLVTPGAVRELQLVAGARVHLLIKASAFHRLL